jgi:hypothetical protein
MTDIKSDNERLSLVNKVCNLHAPDGIGCSRLAGKVGKLLGVDAAARYIGTVSKVLDLACR